MNMNGWYRGGTTDSNRKDTRVAHYFEERLMPLMLDSACNRWTMLKLTAVQAPLDAPHCKLCARKLEIWRGRHEHADA